MVLRFVLRLHIKFLSGDFLTNERLSIDNPALSPACPLCLSHDPGNVLLESTEHVLVTCRATFTIKKNKVCKLKTKASRRVGSLKSCIEGKYCRHSALLIIQHYTLLLVVSFVMNQNRIFCLFHNIIYNWAFHIQHIFLCAL